MLCIPAFPVNNKLPDDHATSFTAPDSVPERKRIDFISGISHSVEMKHPMSAGTILLGRINSTAAIDSGSVVIMTSTESTATSPTLPPCPASPNCVSSSSLDGHRIEPFRITGDPEAAFSKLLQILSDRSDTTVIVVDNAGIKVEFRTLLGFVDDGLFLLDAANRSIQIRSAARLGYWDLGKNRSRMEAIRKSFEGVGL